MLCYAELSCAVPCSILRLDFYICGSLTLALTLILGSALTTSPLQLPARSHLPSRICSGSRQARLCCRWSREQDAFSPCCFEGTLLFPLLLLHITFTFLRTKTLVLYHPNRETQRSSPHIKRKSSQLMLISASPSQALPQTPVFYRTS